MKNKNGTTSVKVNTDNILRNAIESDKRYVCKNCGGEIFYCDGWTYPAVSCKKCGILAPCFKVIGRKTELEKEAEQFYGGEKVKECITIAEKKLEIKLLKIIDKFSTEDRIIREFIEHERCFNCGKKEDLGLSDWCLECLENN